MGYTQVSWDNESGKEPQPASISKKWTDLTGIEKTAAVVLGYSQLSWDDPWPAAYNKNFAELTAAEQTAAGELGFDAKVWDNESGDERPPASWSKSFSELTDKEKAAARVLGYFEFTWDNDSPGEPDSVFKSFNKLRATCGGEKVLEIVCWRWRLVRLFVSVFIRDIRLVEASIFVIIEIRLRVYFYMIHLLYIAHGE